MPTISKAILATLLYADIFDYPLTIHELWKYLIKIYCSKSKMISKLRKIKEIKKDRGFVYFKGRENLIRVRFLRKKYSVRKIKMARSLVSILKLIPSIKMIGITGGLAIYNSKKEDDIDFLVISKRKTLWITRFLITCITEILGLRRRPLAKSIKDIQDKFCFNVYLDEKHLAMPDDRQDFYTAHELVQLRPLYDKGDTYLKFIQANLWVKKYLPNAFDRLKKKMIKDRDKIENRFIFAILWEILISVFEFFFKSIQLLYMRRRQTNEFIANGMIFFHPKDMRRLILRQYKDKLRKYGLSDFLLFD